MRGSLFLLGFVLAVPAGAEPFPVPALRELHPGVAYGEVRIPARGLAYHVVRVDLSAPVRVRPVLARGREESLRELTQRLLAAGEPLLACINGDFYSAGNDRVFCPWGFCLLGGEVAFSAQDDNPVFFLDASGLGAIAAFPLSARVTAAAGTGALEIAGINQPFPRDGTASFLYTEKWVSAAPEIPGGFSVALEGGVPRAGEETGLTVRELARQPVRMAVPAGGCVLVIPGEVPAGFAPGSEVRLRVESPPGRVRDAIGGGFQILRAGEADLEGERRRTTVGKSFYILSGRHPRSALGLSGEGKELLLVAAEGREKDIPGLNMAELIELLKALGARDALVFDGGRSVGLWAGGEMKYNGGRALCNALGIFREPTP